MTFTPEQEQMLSAPLDPKHVVKPSGSFGPKGDYIEGWHAINEANRIFGFGGWSYTIRLSRDALEQATVEKKDYKTGETKSEQQWEAAYTCICRFEVGDVVREAVGFGSGFAKRIGDAIEGATKEAETDALKRALRSFGNQFGLALYDKTRVNVQAAPPPTITDSQREELMGLCDALNFPVDRVLTAVKIIDLRQLPAEKFEGAKKWINENAPKEKDKAA